MYVFLLSRHIYIYLIAYVNYVNYLHLLHEIVNWWEVYLKQCINYT